MRSFRLSRALAPVALAALVTACAHDQTNTANAPASSTSATNQTTTTTTYWVDSSAGEWRVHRADGGPGYDFSYRFVRYDKSPTADQSSCR